ncbi:MAG: hypothetical protein ACI4PE_04645 [Bacilli bacterium]
MNSKTRLLDNLSPIQKNIYGLYNLVITDEMLTKEYRDSLEEKISTCRSFEETNFLRTRIFAIEDYRRQRNMEVLELSGVSSLDELLKDKNGNINYKFYDFIKELAEEGKKSLKSNKLSR